MRSYKNYQRHLSALQTLSDAESLPKFSLKGSKRPAKVVRCVDGDTVVLAMIIDERPALFHTRLMGIDAPEMRPRKTNPNRDAIKREAKAAKEALETLMPAGQICAVECGEFDLHGRLLAASIRVAGVDPIEEMVTQGYVVRVSDGCREKDWDSMWQRLQEQRQRHQRATTSKRLTGATRSIGRSETGLPRASECCAGRRWWHRILLCCRR